MGLGARKDKTSKTGRAGEGEEHKGRTRGISLDTLEEINFIWQGVNDPQRCRQEGCEKRDAMILRGRGRREVCSGGTLKDGAGKKGRKTREWVWRAERVRKLVMELRWREGKA